MKAGKEVTEKEFLFVLYGVYCDCTVYCVPGCAMFTRIWLLTPEYESRIHSHMTVTLI